MKDAAAIVGIGATRFGKGIEASEEELAGEAILAALTDAGLSPSSVDGVCSYTLQGLGEDDLARNLGIGELAFFARAPAGGGGACALVGHAAMAIATGQAKVVVAYRSRKRSARSSRMWSQAPHDAYRRDWLNPYGLVRPVDDVAVLARRYMHLYGASRDSLAAIAVAVRTHANLNPAAMMYGRELTTEQHLAARPIAEPLGLFDCCLESDGAAAVVLTSAARAAQLRGTPAYVHAFAQGVSEGSGTMATLHGPDPLRTQSRACGERLWERSDFRPSDMSSAQIYDAFTPEVWFALEGYGFCDQGEAHRFVMNGGIGLGGRLPMNTSGGGLSEVYLHGFNHVLEAVRQIRGTSTAQVSNTQAVFVCGSDLVPTSALVLRA